MTIARRPVTIWLSEDEMTCLGKWCAFIQNMSIQDAANIALRYGIPHMLAEVDAKVPAKEQPKYWFDKAARVGYRGANDIKQFPDEWPTGWHGELNVQPNASNLYDLRKRLADVPEGSV